MPDLALKPESTKSEPSISQPTYPTLSLRDGQVEAVKGEHECKVGDEYDAYVRLRVKGITDDEFGNRLEFDVLNMDDFTPAEGVGENDEEEEEAPEEKPAKNGKATKALTYADAAPSAP